MTSNWTSRMSSYVQSGAHSSLGARYHHSYEINITNKVTKLFYFDNEASFNVFRYLFMKNVTTFEWIRLLIWTLYLYYHGQVDLMRSFTFRNSKGSYSGIPIIAANMDTVGTFEMALALHQVECCVPLKRAWKGNRSPWSVCEHWINQVLFEQCAEGDERVLITTVSTL